LSKEGTPLCRGNLVEKPPNKPAKTQISMGGGNFCCVNGGRRVTFLDHHILRTFLSQFPWWYHGLARGWCVVESDSTARPKVGRKEVISQLVGLDYSLSYKCLYVLILTVNDISECL
jgi:hypothetical protein